LSNDLISPCLSSFLLSVSASSPEQQSGLARAATAGVSKEPLVVNVGNLTLAGLAHNLLKQPG